MAAIERAECVWTDRGLCFGSRVPSSGPTALLYAVFTLALATGLGAGPTRVNQTKSNLSCGSDERQYFKRIKGISC